jgi:hypothetical protein
MMIVEDPQLGLVWQFTLDELKSGTPTLEGVEEWWGGEIDRLDDGRTYDDLLDRLDGSPWLGEHGAWYKVDLGDETDTPVYRRLTAIGRRVRAESR